MAHCLAGSSWNSATSLRPTFQYTAARQGDAAKPVLCKRISTDGPRNRL